MNTDQAPAWLPSLLVPFFTLSYPTAPPSAPDSFPNSKYYGTGPLDVCLIITAIAVMAILRDVTRLFVWEPFARWKLGEVSQIEKPEKLAVANGHANGTYRNGVANGNGKSNGHGMAVSPAKRRKIHRSVVRFAEQGWAAISYITNCSYGVYVHSHLPTAVLNPINVWTNYPHFPLAGPVKFYYLLQTAFYLHQVLILNAEARRKDHWQMMTHHVITITLMISSYFYNYTRVGCLVMVLMDVCDCFFPLAKMFRYLGMSLLCDITFGVFMVSWFVTRHILFNLVIKATWECWYYIPRVWDPPRGHYMTKETYYGFVSLLVALQVLQLVWFGMICRVAYRVISGQGAEDSRSDDEDDENNDPKKND